jgi:hypothetical protein
MRAGFEYYRAFPQDAIQNENYSKTKLTMPVLAVGAGYIPALGGNITMPTIVYGMQTWLKMLGYSSFKFRSLDSRRAARFCNRTAR